jgi:cytochrome oxidase Cu insertion factor (SCO1/SenC/PrrC family)
MRHLIPIVLLAACTQADTEPIDTAAAVPCGPSAERGLEVGQCAPEFTLPDRTGQAFTLSAQRGKVALVDISALW